MVLSDLPELHWQVLPQNWQLEPLTMRCAARTDLFIAPQADVQALNAPRLLFAAPEDFLLSARVTVDFGSTFDAGALLIWQHETSWAKLCFEYSPQADPMIVSVVNKDSSDDCNSVFIEAHSVYLRIAKIGSAYAFHHSTDGKIWHLTRHFALAEAPTQAGFLAQSPTGEGCTISFTDIEYRPQRLTNLRSGE